MIRSLNNLVLTVGIIIIPIGAVLVVQQLLFAKASLQSSITSMVAAVIGMIPEGLYLLASIAPGRERHAAGREKKYLSTT